MQTRNRSARRNVATVREESSLAQDIVFGPPIVLSPFLVCSPLERLLDQTQDARAAAMTPRQAESVSRDCEPILLHNLPRWPTPNLPAIAVDVGLPPRRKRSREPAPPDPELVDPAPQQARHPFQGTYKRARDLAGTVFPVSEAVILQAARKLGIGRKLGRTIVFSQQDIERLYEELPCLSGSSAAPIRPAGSSAGLSAEAASRRARKLLMMDAQPAKGSPKKSVRGTRSRSSSKPSMVVAFRQPSGKRR